MEVASVCARATAVAGDAADQGVVKIKKKYGCVYKYKFGKDHKNLWEREYLPKSKRRDKNDNENDQ